MDPGTQHVCCARARRVRLGTLGALLLLFPAVAHAIRKDPELEYPAVSIDAARVQEGDAGLTNLVFLVHLSKSVGWVVTFDYSTQDGTAKVADNDYIATSGHFTFPPGDTLGTISVPVRGDTNLEATEWLRLHANHPDGATLATINTDGQIINDERATFIQLDTQAQPYYSGSLPDAWGDFDGDGYPDLPLYHTSPNGILSEIPGFRDLLDNGNYHGGAWCDYDRDGDLDLVLLGYSGVEGGSPTPTRLLRNDGAGGFVDVAPQLGLNVVGSGETAVWGDFDGDGWPDLFTPYYSFIFPFQSFLYHNNGNGTFTEQAAADGVDLANIQIELRPEGAAAADWNDDGHLDLYCASHLFLNDGTGHFTDVREAVGLPIVFDEGASFVDYDNDGDLDLYVRGEDAPHLFRNDGGHFTEVTAAAGIPAVSLAWSDAWADVDGDGDLDLLLMCGDGTARLMLNQGDGTFVRDTVFDQLHVPADLSAWADFNGTGDLDLVVGSGYTRTIYENQSFHRPDYFGSQMAVRVLDADGHQTQHGATVRLREMEGGPGSIQTRIVDGGSGYLGQSDYDVHFGGLHSGRYSLDVVFPSPQGSRVVVDSLVNPLLAGIGGGSEVPTRMTIYRDGRVELSLAQTTGVARSADVPELTRPLGIPVPRPANSEVRLPLRLTHSARVQLLIHDLGGRVLRTLDPGSMDQGSHQLTWDLTDDRGRRVATGVYFCQLLLNGRRVDSGRIVVLR